MVVVAPTPPRPPRGGGRCRRRHTRGDILRGGDSLLVLGVLHSVTNPRSICSGISGDKDLLDATKRKGTSLPMVDPESEGEIFPDIQFWKQCVDPVLAQDPFSSLMSALFCLPIEVLTSTEFFIPIVHLFYIVCVIQVTNCKHDFHLQCILEW
ncbi:hypothetical protein ZWY2020_005693 [Hordeum vulgare]|nr:hypothetical protein ZWY2020_005693 [Hordeum vulgare]